MKTVRNISPEILKEKIMLSCFTEFHKHRTISFWIAAGAAVLSVISAVVYAAAVMGEDEVSRFVNIVPFILLLAGGLIFAVAALFRKSRLGALVMGLLDLFAFVVFLGYFAAYPASTAVANDGGGIISLPGFAAAIAVAVLMFICIVLSDVCAWRKLDICSDAAGGENA